MSRIGKRCFLIWALLGLFVCTGACLAQQPRVLWETDLFDEDSVKDFPGYHVFLYPVISDVIGDASPEIVVGLQYGGYNYVYLLDGRSGSIVWDEELGGGMYYSISVVDEGEKSKKLVVGSEDHHFYVFDAKTGELLEKNNHGEKIRIISSADINSDGISDYAVIGDWLNVSVYNGKTWERMWEFASEIDIDGVSVDDIDLDGSPEVITLYNRNQVAIMDALTGETEWMFELGTRRIKLFLKAPNIASAHGTASINGERVIVVGTGLGDILVFNGKTGDILHQKKGHTGHITGLSTGDLNGDGFFDVVLTSTDHKVYAVNGKGLEGLWEYRTDGEIYSSPALGDMDNDGLLDVIIVSGDDKMYCIDGREGELIWDYEIGIDCGAGNPLLADVNADGLVDVVVDGPMYGGNLTILETSARCKVNEILWPKVFGNNRNTGAFGEK